MLMRQSSLRCFGSMLQGNGVQSSQTSLTRLAGLTFEGTQSVQYLAPTLAKYNKLNLTAQSHQAQRSLTTFQKKKDNEELETLGRRSMSSNHPKIWSAEKLVSLAMVPIVIVPFVWTTPLTDAIFCTFGYNSKITWAYDFAIMIFMG